MTDTYRLMMECGILLGLEAGKLMLPEDRDKMIAELEAKIMAARKTSERK